VELSHAIEQRKDNERLHERSANTVGFERSEIILQGGFAERKICCRKGQTKHAENPQTMTSHACFTFYML
jgi:hypothetical protein